MIQPTYSSQVYSLEGLEELRTMGNSLTIAYDLSNNWKLKSITAFRRVHEHAVEDLSGAGSLTDPFYGTNAPFTLLGSLVDLSQTQESREEPRYGGLWRVPGTGDVEP